MACGTTASTTMCVTLPAGMLACSCPFRSPPVVLRLSHAPQQGWNKMWDEWVEQTGLTKFKKELVAIEFKAEGDGGDGEPGGAAAAATTDAGGRAGGKKRKAEDLEAHANGTVTPAQVSCPVAQLCVHA